MSNPASAPTNTGRSQDGEEPGKPLAPMWMFKVMNPIMKGLLRSPLHGLMSGSLMLITYAGRKTGKPYTIPFLRF